MASKNGARPWQLSAGPTYSVAGWLRIAQCQAFFIEETRSKRVADRFLITYAEPQAHQETRFAAWLEAALVEGLKRWRETVRA